jgi:hypothetical protein
MVKYRKTLGRIFRNGTIFKKNLPLLFSTVTLLSYPLQADEYTKQVVMEVYPRYSNEDFTYQGNFGVEKIFRTNDWIKYYGKPSLTYALNKNWRNRVSDPYPLFQYNSSYLRL